MPTKNSHSDQLLTDFSIGFMQDSKVFAGDQSCTMRKVNRQSDKYRIYDVGNIMRNDMRVVAPDEASPVITDKMSLDTYFCPVRRGKMIYTDQDRNNDDDPVSTEKNKVGTLSTKAQISREVDFATKVFATGIWTVNTEQVGTTDFTKWSDASSTPITDINEQKLIVRNSCGFMPNTFTISEEVAMELLEHASIVAKYQYVTGGPVDLVQLANALRVEKVIIGGGAYNSAAEGLTDSLGAIFGKHALLSYIDHSSNGSAGTPTAVTCFSWTQHDRKTPQGAAIRRWRNEDPQGDYLEAAIAFDYKQTSNASGVFFKDAVA